LIATKLGIGEATHESIVLVEHHPDFILDEIKTAPGAPTIITAALKQMA